MHPKWLFTTEIRASYSSPSFLGLSSSPSSSTFFFLVVSETLPPRQALHALRLPTIAIIEAIQPSFFATSSFCLSSSLFTQVISIILDLHHPINRFSSDCRPTKVVFTLLHIEPYRRLASSTFRAPLGACLWSYCSILSLTSQIGSLSTIRL